jgi:hypothetical protein
VEKGLAEGPSRSLWFEIIPEEVEQRVARDSATGREAKIRQECERLTGTEQLRPSCLFE